MSEPFFAHSGNRKDRADWQLLRDHLRQVAEGAHRRASEAGLNSELQQAAENAGWLHDLGKYRPGFQAMMRGLPTPRIETYHKQAGALRAFQTKNYPVALAIAGHHGGLPNFHNLKDMVRDAIQVTNIWPDAVRDCPALANLSLNSSQPNDIIAVEIWTRLVFSILVDADWEDTATHERGVVQGLPPELPPPSLDAKGLLARVLSYIQERARRSKEPSLAAIRNDILKVCLAVAEKPPGLFSLTVPTGGGKTLSGLSFALHHAERHGLRRVIYVAPYLSILEQNARVFREALGVLADDPTLFEHHSLAEPPGDDNVEETVRQAAARRAENWDAPIVVTTSVQFFESLFAHKPGRCRKFHNMARSVILLDECQTVPPGLVAPTTSMLSHVARMLGSTLVLCTATQPAFDHKVLEAARLQNVCEIVPTSWNLFGQLKRVCVTWPSATDPPMTWDVVAERMRTHPAALCVVNTRRAARDLFIALKHQGKNVFHLSTSQCPAHRLAILDEVRNRLEQGQPCYLASTQLIEAGVDVDFPFLMREIGPLESIIQAAGRCNREGLLRGVDGTPGGQVVVFRSTDGAMPPDRWYRAGREVLEQEFLNAGREPRLEAPEDIQEYFRRLYHKGSLDMEQIQAARQKLAFEQVGTAYRLIQDDGDALVVATWEQKRDEIERLLDMVRRQPTRSNFRKLSPYQVNMRRHERVALDGCITEEIPGLLIWYGKYDSESGLQGGNADGLLMV